MIVVLTARHTALAYTALNAAHREDIAEWLDRHASVADGPQQRHTLIAPACAWAATRDALIDWTHGDQRRARTRSAATQEAYRQVTRRVARATAVREAHPAMQGKAALGKHGEILPAWPNGSRWSPYPVPGVEMVFLEPRWRRMKLGTVTQWLPVWAQLYRRDGSHELFGEIHDPAVHVQFAFGGAQDGERLVDAPEP